MKLPILKLVAKAEPDMVVARFRTKQIAELAGLSTLETTRLLTAVSEIIRNAIVHAGEARIQYRIYQPDKRQYVEVMVTDHGPGFSDIKQTQRDSGGIYCSRKLLDDLIIESDPENGTTVRMLKLIDRHHRWLEIKDVESWIETLKKNSPFSVVEDLEQEKKQLIDAMDELAQSRAKLEEKTEQLDQANKYKGEFLANMSHEIRTPMNAVIGISNILDRTELTPEQKKYLHLIKESGNSLLDIINDILDFSKIEAGKLVIEDIEFELFDLVETCTEILSQNAHSKGLGLITFIDPQVPGRLRGDPVRIKQILVNLVNNAIKFTSEGEIVVRVKETERTADKSTLRFEVIDCGIGLSQEQQRKLFQPFVQADGSTTRKYGGTGLGLSICKQLADLMKGKIGVESVQGAGSTFWFEIPFGTAETDKKEKVSLPYKLALLVDDYPAIREMAACWLDSWGISSKHAESGEEALALVNKNKFDLIIIDYVMPGMNGLELVERLRQSKENDNIKIILLTALQEHGLGERAIAAGCSAFLTKPMRPSHLLDCLMNKTPSTTFSRELATVPAPAAVSAGGNHLRPASASSSATANATPTGDTAPTNAGTESARAQVLLVEDNPTNQMVASIELERLGLKVTIADNGKAALKHIASQNFSIVFMDCQMPVMDGYEATRNIRLSECKTGRRIPIVAMTANAMEGDRQKCLEAGMDDYITKPFEPDHLNELVQRWLKKQGSEACVAVQSVPAPASGMATSAPESTEDGAVALDYDRLRGRFTEAQCKRLLDSFLMDTEKKMAELGALIDQNNIDEAAKVAHGVKGAAAMIFAEPFAEAARVIEISGKAKENADYKGMYSRLQKAYACLLAATKPHIS